MLHVPFGFVQSRNTFVHISTQCIPRTNGLQYCLLCLMTYFIYLISLLSLARHRICLSNFLFCCGSVNCSSSWSVVCHSKLKVQQPPVSCLPFFGLKGCYRKGVFAFSLLVGLKMEGNFVCEKLISYCSEVAKWQPDGIKPSRGRRPLDNCVGFASHSMCLGLKSFISGVSHRYGKGFT